MNPRASQLLKSLVEIYLEEGKPVGSRILSKVSNLKLSSATVRNIVADLEEQGFVTAPHTSAGRIPTLQGYRFFVDTLLEIKPLSQQELEDLTQKLSYERDPAELMQLASVMMSELTNLVSIVKLPKSREKSSLQQVEFILLPDNRVLVLLIFNQDKLENRIILTEKSYTQKELQKISNILNEKLAYCKDLTQLRSLVLEEYERIQRDKDCLLRKAFDLLEDSSEGKLDVTDSLILSGKNHVLDFEDLLDINDLRKLFHALEEKESILYILDHCLKAQGTTIFIGQEAGVKALDQCSVVTAPYSVDNQIVGALGVIGPTRMAYSRIIPIVDITAKLLSQALNPENSSSS